MFFEESEIKDSRPVLAVMAQGMDFLDKYFDRRFDRRITRDVNDATDTSCAFVITRQEESIDDATNQFIDQARHKGIPVVRLIVPLVVGTGMNGLMMRIAKGVSRGNVTKIRDNNARWTVVHATDVANAASVAAPNGEQNYTLDPTPVNVNDLLDAMAFRIKDKRLMTLKSHWAKLLCGNELFNQLTSDRYVSGNSFSATFPEFEFVNPVKYLTTHVYDNESL